MALVLGFVAASPRPNLSVPFYHWQTRLALSPAEQQRLLNLGLRAFTPNFLM
ncbi:MAG: hypothetical protein IPO07_19710 [Haliscomenobacter sp.]|nr:hypothetical protein [Haliscomenobacter sp.]MBK9490757.1 hypothetical protein [Haliscomenobacter sp.]